MFARIILGLACAAALGPVPASAAVPTTVDDCVRLALAHSPAPQAAAAGVSAAAARVRAAAAAYLPKLLAEAEYGRSAGLDEAVTDGGRTLLGLRVEMPLLDGGLRRAQLAAARAQLTSAEAIERQWRADVALAVRTAYFAALAARREAAIESEAAATLRAYVSLLRQQERQGSVTRDEVLRAQLARRSAESAGRGARSVVASKLQELDTLTATEVAPEALAEPQDVPIPRPGGDRLEASPALVEARAALASAQRHADAVRSEKRARLTLTASGGFLGVRPGPTFRDNGGGEFLVGFNFPIFDGGLAAARIAAATAVAQGAAANLKKVRQTLRIALSRAQIEAQYARNEMNAWRRAIPEANESFQLARARYFGGGNVRLLEVLDAMTRLVEARLAYSHAQLAYRTAVATQQDVLGEAAP